MEQINDRDIRTHTRPVRDGVVSVRVEHKPSNVSAEAQGESYAAARDAAMADLRKRLLEN